MSNTLPEYSSREMAATGQGEHFLEILLGQTVGSKTLKLEPSMFFSFGVALGRPLGCLDTAPRCVVYWLPQG